MIRLIAVWCASCVGGAGGFEVVDASVLSWQLFPVSYSFFNEVNGSEAVLREISACRLVPGRSDLVTLVGDDGELVTVRSSRRSRVRRSRIVGDLGDVRERGYVEGRPVLSGGSDARGRVPVGQRRVRVRRRPTTARAFPAFSRRDATRPLVRARGPRPSVGRRPSLSVRSGPRAQVSTEWHVYKHRGTSPLDVAVFSADGAYVESPYAIPSGTLARVKDNEGFEGVTLARGAIFGLDGDVVVTTTEYALDGDPDGSHEVLVWASGARGAPPARTLAYESSRDASGTHLGVTEFEALDDSLLVLERTYENATSNLIRLFEAEEANGVLEKKPVFEWDRGALKLGDVAVRVPVDNYEGMCLLPSTDGGRRRRLLLVNDDNENPSQIGTQFLLLELALKSADQGPPQPRRAVSSSKLLAAASVLSLLAFSCAVATCFLYLRSNGGQQPHQGLALDPAACQLVPPQQAKYEKPSDELTRGLHFQGSHYSGLYQPSQFSGRPTRYVL